VSSYTYIHLSEQSKQQTVNLLSKFTSYDPFINVLKQLIPDVTRGQFEIPKSPSLDGVALVVQGSETNIYFPYENIIPAL
jgi:hypothetical protein